MALDAGEVFVVVGSKLDSGSIARSRAALKSLEGASNDYQKAITRGEEASNRLHAANQRWAHAAVIGAKASAIGIGTVVAALSGAAIAAASFDASMRNVNSIAGLGERQFKLLEAQVLRLSTAVGKSPKDLAEGLYSIVSSGFKANDAMKILTAGARAARAGLTDTATATGALTAVLNSYGLKATDARKVSDVLFQTVNVGVLNFQQLAGSLGKVLSPAAAIGVSLKDLSGALAALTLRGNSADEAATQLGQTMVALQKPSPALAKVLKSLGYESGTAAIKAIGFKGTLDQIAAAAKKTNTPLADIFGNVRALRGVQGLEGTAKAAAVFTSSVKAMDDATKGAGATAKVYAEQQKSTAAQFDHLKAAIDVAAVTIGSALLPQINAGITALTKWFAEAQKSGEITQWAHTIANAVSEVVTFLHSLGPAASQAFHVVVATVQAAIPFVEGLVHALQAVEPELSAVAHAASGLASALGPGPILVAAAAFLTLKRATLTGQVAVGTFAKVMQAGERSIGTSGAGIALAGGRFNKVGAEAIKASSGVKIFARGLVSTIGTPNLIAAGVAGIVLGLVTLHNSLSNITKEAQQAADALLHLNDVRLNRQSAALDVRVAQVARDKARASAGSAAAGVASARLDASTLAQGGHPDIANPQITAAINRQRDAILNYQQAENRLAQAHSTLGQKTSDLKKASEDLGRQFGGLAHQADSAAKAQVASERAAEIQQGRLNVVSATAAQKANIWGDALIKAAKNADGATAASIRTATGIAGLVKQMGNVPDKKVTQLIVDDLKAGRSLKQIRADLIRVGALTPTPKVDANTTPANRKMDAVTAKAHGLDALRPTVHLGQSGFNAVETAISRINTNILHLTSTPFTVKVNYATSGSTTPTGGSPKVNRKAVGFKTSGAEIIQVGEDGQEYVIPTSGKYKAGGIALWMQAGHDLGIPGYAKGKKPGKTPPPIHRGLGYDPAALDAQQTSEKQRLDQARQYRDTLNTRLGSDHTHHKSLEKQLETAKRGTKSKNKATVAAAEKRVTALTVELKRLDEKIKGEQAARDRQRDAVIPRDTKRYEAATRAANIGNKHASQITLWQDRADADTTAMSTASAQWDQADRKKDAPGKKKAYDAWLAAQRGRGDALGHVKALLQEVAKVVGATDYGAKIKGQLSGIIGDIVAAQDETAAPGYVDPNAAPSTNIDDYLYPEERAALAQAALDEARAAATADTADDVTAAEAALGVANWIGNRLQIDGAPIDILTQAYQDIASARSSLQSAIQGNTPSGSTSVSADQQAALTQAQQQRDAAQANADSARKALEVFQGSGELFRGGQSVSVTVQAMSAGDPAVQRQIGTELTKALGSQNAVPATTGFYNG